MEPSNPSSPESPRRAGIARVFQSKVMGRTTRNPLTGCLLWSGPTTKGYGKVWMGSRAEFIHRVAYVATKGPIPPGHDIDHRCRTRNCVEPAHLEAVTRAENLRRGMGLAAVTNRTKTCKRGHAFVAKNLYQRGGKRQCRLCVLDNRRNRKTK